MNLTLDPKYFFSLQKTKQNFLFARRGAVRAASIAAAHFRRAQRVQTLFDVYRLDALLIFSKWVV